MAKSESKKSAQAQVDDGVQDRDERARSIIRKCAWGSAGIGLLPVPIVDMVAVGGLQVWLVSELSKIYEVPFSRDRAKALVSALIGAVTPAALTGTAVSLVKLVPVVGQLLTIAVAPGLAGASTLALGRVFNAHFQTGGTLLDFDAEKMAAYYKDELGKAKEEMAAAKA